MRIRFVLLFSLAALVFCAAAVDIGRTNPAQAMDSTQKLILDLKAKLTNFYGAQTAMSQNTPVGSEYCIACHEPFDPEFDEYHNTLHAFFIRKPMGMWSMVPGKGVICDFDQNGVDDFKQGVDFNTVTNSPFEAQKPNAPILSYDAGTDSYYVKLGPSGLMLKVGATLGGATLDNGQRYMCYVPVSDGDTGWSDAVYFGPLAWGGTSISSNASNWYTGNTPKYAPGVTRAQLAGLQGQNWLKTCSGCHITQIRNAYVTPSGEWVVNPYPATLIPTDSPNYPDVDGDGIPDMVNIGCESCHGPGSLHILGHGDPAKIVNPADITNNQQRSAVCLQCHVQIASAPSKMWGFTYNETANHGFVVTNPPDDLNDYQVFTGGMWPDGVNFISARVDSYKVSAHYTGSHGIACNDCHNPHAETANPAQVRDSVTRSGSTVANTNVVDDSFCLSCHNGSHFLNIDKTDIINWKASGFEAPIPDNIRDAIESHTHHPYGANRMMGLSQCIGCHMPPTAGHGTIDGHTHTFWPAEPEATIEYAGVTGLAYAGTGNVNACSATCHRGRARLWYDVPILNTDWNNNKFGTQDEVNLAEHLVQYFGPGGVWWDTTPAKMEKAHK
jgi:hypothetical protein